MSVQLYYLRCASERLVAGMRAVSCVDQELKQLQGESKDKPAIQGRRWKIVDGWSSPDAD